MEDLSQPNVRKSLVKFLLILLLISMISHWRDIKQGAVDGFTGSFASIGK